MYISVHIGGRGALVGAPRVPGEPGAFLEVVVPPGQQGGGSSSSQARGAHTGTEVRGERCGGRGLGGATVDRVRTSGCTEVTFEATEKRLHLSVI